MQQKSFLKILTLVFVTLLTSVNKGSLHLDATLNGRQTDHHIKAEQNTGLVSMLDFASFLADKKEHYPLSDEFVEKYQQAGGGYIDYARQLGMVVDRHLHEPNQKWHFFESWLFESIRAGTLTWDADARSRVYINLKSPELLLWIFEASGVSPTKVRRAMTAAEEGRVNNLHVATLAKNMRDEVPWEDVIANMDRTVKMATSVELSESDVTLTIGEEPKVVTAMVTPSDTTDVAAWSVTSGSEFIKLTAIGNKVTINALKEGNATVEVKYNDFISATLNITVNEPDVTKIIGVPQAIDLDLNKEILLTPALNYGESTFSYVSSDPTVASVTSNGQVTGHKYGSAEITVTSQSDNSLTKVVDVEVFNHGSLTTPLSVSELLSKANKVLLTNGDTSFFPLFAKGKALTNSTTNGAFSLQDENNSQSSIIIASSVTAPGVALPAMHDTVTLTGHAKLSNNKLELAHKEDVEVRVLENIRGEATITIGEDAFASLYIDETKFTAPITHLNGTLFSFSVVPEEGYLIEQVTANDLVLIAEDNLYTFEVRGDTVISVTALDASNATKSLATYDIIYDLGARKTAKEITDASELLSVFILTSGAESIITTINDFERIYGGGNGGRSETAWYAGDMLKFGTTSVNGSLELNLTKQVNQIKITGYTTHAGAVITVGDSKDLTTFTVSDLTLTEKTAVESGNTSTVIVNFSRTNTLTIATTNKRPIYITELEFIYAVE